MALLNPPEIRVSVLNLIASYLAQCRGGHDEIENVINVLSPPSLSSDHERQSDVKTNINGAVEIGLLVRDGTKVTLEEKARSSAKAGPLEVARTIRTLVLSEELNSEPWGSQKGARDLTNGISWFLTFPPTEAPIDMEGGSRSAKELQERDFGPRQSQKKLEEGDANGSWPISNGTRWTSFRRWVCSLGFGWSSPTGAVIPDPTVAIRDAIPSIFGKHSKMAAPDFINNLAQVLPVLEMGSSRRMVASHWNRVPTDDYALSSPTTEALNRLVFEGTLVLDDSHDATRITRWDGSTFSDVLRTVRK